LEEYDHGGMSGVRFAQYVGIKYTTLAYWLKRRRLLRKREKLLIKAGADTEPGKKRWEVDGSVEIPGRRPPRDTT
jgi:hypothetical protein